MGCGHWPSNHKKRCLGYFGLLMSLEISKLFLKGRMLKLPFCELFGGGRYGQGQSPPERIDIF